MEEPPRDERRRERVEVGAQMGSDQLHGGGLYRPRPAGASAYLLWAT